MAHFGYLGYAFLPNYHLINITCSNNILKYFFFPWDLWWEQYFHLPEGWDKTSHSVGIHFFLFPECTGFLHHQYLRKRGTRHCSMRGANKLVTFAHFRSFMKEELITTVLKSYVSQKIKSILKLCILKILSTFNHVLKNSRMKITKVSQCAPHFMKVQSSYNGIKIIKLLDEFHWVLMIFLSFSLEDNSLYQLSSWKRKWKLAMEKFQISIKNIFCIYPFIQRNFSFFKNILYLYIFANIL